MGGAGAWPLAEGRRALRDVGESFFFPEGGLGEEAI